MRTTAVKSALAIAFCACLWAAFIPARGVWAPDEARYAEVAREMKERGSWVIPYLNGEVYTQKPPLFFAAIRLFSADREGVPESAAKLPSLISALVLLVITALMAHSLYGGRAAWVAPLALGTMGKFAWQAQFGQIDMLVSALVGMQIWLGIATGEERLRRPIGIGLMVLFGWAGILTKGPVVVVLPWAITAIYLLLNSGKAGFKKFGLGWIVAPVIALSALWLVIAAAEAGWDYPRALVLKQTVQRYVEPWHHIQHWYYYIPVLFGDSLPYSPMLFPLAWLLVAKRKVLRGEKVLLPLIWIGCYILFFSFSAGKRSVYILPLYPAVALLLAYGVERWQSGDLGRKSFGYISGFLAAMSIGGCIYFGLNVPGGYSGIVPFAYAGAMSMVACALAATIFSSRRKYGHAFAALAAGFGAVMVITVLPAVARLDGVKAPRSLAHFASGHLAGGGKLGVFPSLIPSVNYYLETSTQVFKDGEESAASHFISSDSRNILLVEDSEWKGPIPPHEVLFRTRVGDSKYAVWSNGEKGKVR